VVIPSRGEEAKYVIATTTTRSTKGTRCYDPRPPRVAAGNYLLSWSVEKVVRIAMIFVSICISVTFAAAAMMKKNFNVDLNNY